MGLGFILAMFIDIMTNANLLDVIYLSIYLSAVLMSLFISQYRPRLRTELFGLDFARTGSCRVKVLVYNVRHVCSVVEFLGCLLSFIRARLTLVRENSRLLRKCIA